MTGIIRYYRNQSGSCIIRYYRNQSGNRIQLPPPRGGAAAGRLCLIAAAAVLHSSITLISITLHVSTYCKYKQTIASIVLCWSCRH